MCSPLHCTTFSRRRRHSLILRSRNACDSCHAVTIALFSFCTDLKLLQWSTISWSVPQTACSPTDSDLRCLVVTMPCSARWMTFSRYCFWRCETARTVLLQLQRPLVMAAHCTEAVSNPWPQTFSSLILTVNLGPWFHKHNACLSCARNADRHCDVGVLMLHYQVSSYSR